MIVLRNISKIFDQGKASITAVDSVNLSVEQGQIYGLSATAAPEKVR
jgi:D-methionine transport system ATP-binding protein